MEFKKCKLKISQVLLHTMCFGHMDMEFSVIDAENLVVEVPNIGIVHLDAAVDADINGFIKLNARSDEDHQIDLDTLYVDTIEIAECAPCPTLRIRYAFQQSEEFWRCCAGREHTMEMVKINEKLHVPGKITYWALALYSPDCAVFW